MASRIRLKVIHAEAERLGLKNKVGVGQEELLRAERKLQASLKEDIVDEEPEEELVVEVEEAVVEPTPVVEVVKPVEVVKAPEPVPVKTKKPKKKKKKAKKA